MKLGKASIIQVRPRNDVYFDASRGIYKNGADNMYPTRVELIVNASVTASQCRKLLQKFITGKGFENQSLDKLIIGYDEMGKVTGLKLLRKIAESISYHNGVFVHVNFNILGQITGLSVLPYRWCRFSGVDELTGKYSQIAVYNNWDCSVKLRTNWEEVQYFPVFNVEKVQEQFATGDFRGQIMFFNYTDLGLYPLAPIDPAITDADTEARISFFKNKTLVSGFLDKTIMRHAPFDSKEDAEAFKRVVRDFQGTENTEDIMLLEDTFTSDNDKGNLRIDRFESKINDKLFESWEKTCPNNIRRCYENPPPMLIDYVEGKLGGTSGESYRESINFYNSQTEDERMAVSAILGELLQYWHSGRIENTNIIPVSSPVQSVAP